MTFYKELESLINKHSMECSSNTPDFILANYLKRCLCAFNEATIAREVWYGRLKIEETEQRDICGPIQKKESS